MSGETGTKLKPTAYDNDLMLLKQVISNWMVLRGIRNIGAGDSLDDVAKLMASAAYAVYEAAEL